MYAIQCYAPNNDSNDDDKDQFYERLQSIIAKCPEENLTILMGDLNDKFGMDNNGYEDIMRRHGLTGRNEREWRFANLCAFNKLVIDNIQERKDERTVINNSQTGTEDIKAQAEFTEALEPTSGNTWKIQSVGELDEGFGRHPTSGSTDRIP
ncbi:unnamed protein product [Schistosoma mattheei]|uniref:Uncharacterized protein n=1 Tax=Schistosoma mattheei TaxID=31246 RepID=A0A183NQJ4_9TREM|nr:unnamed protein product [Schistosoma mattheei]